MKSSSIFLFFLFLFLIFYLGKFIFLPLFLALFFYLVIKSVTNKLLLSINSKLGVSLSKLNVMAIMLFTISIFSYFLWIILELNINAVLQKSNIYQINFEKILSYLSKKPFNSLMEKTDFVGSFDMLTIFSDILNSLSSFAGNFAFVIIFIIFLIFEENHLKKKLNSVLSSSNIKVLNKINYDIFFYFQLKTITSFLTGISTFIILFFLENDLAPTFGIFSFFLNFIPFIGSILSVLLPFIFSAVQFLNFFEPSLTFFLLLLIQIYIGNFLEPKLMGKTLNISPLVMIIFLTIMGKIWGVAGMFLSVPLLVIILIILRNMKSTKKIAIILSESGEL